MTAPRTAGRTAAEWHDEAERVLASPPVRQLAGQLAAFPLDDVAPAEPARQLHLFDPETI